MIDKNGENIYPEEIEREICASESVNDAYVTQIQDQMQMDQIAALVQFVEMTDNRDALVKELRNTLVTKLPIDADSIDYLSRRRNSKKYNRKSFNHRLQKDY